jgi:hypothetical protein
MKGRIREPLTVGLDRHKRHTNTVLPAWVEEHIGWLSVLVVVACVGAVTLLINPSGELVRPTRREEQAHLAVVMGPMKRWAPGSEETLVAMKMTVKNLGPAVAQYVLVQGLTKNSALPLVGPTELQPNEQKEYVLDRAVTLEKGASLVVQYLCWNCPLTPGPSPAEVEELVGFAREQAILSGEISH